MSLKEKITHQCLDTYLSLTYHKLQFFFSELDDSDYTLVQSMGSFQSGDTRSCTSITILGDNRVEGTENFTVTLTGNSEVKISSAAGTVTVEINDDDGKFTLYTTMCWS